ncbi:hypothetical protein [Shewanella maritima]|uniref:hypothetical protein n=1 Tax=Shewanella maritima TaxID=2520507 RepID=UPI003736CC7B
MNKFRRFSRLVQSIVIRLSILCTILLTPQVLAQATDNNPTANMTTGNVEVMDEYHFRLCIMLEQRLKDKQQDHSSHFIDGRNFAMQGNQALSELLKHRDELSEARIKELNDIIAKSNEMSAYHENRMNSDEETIEFFQKDFSETCDNRRAEDDIVIKHCDGPLASILNGEFCKTHLNAVKTKASH